MPQTTRVVVQGDQRRDLKIVKGEWTSAALLKRRLIDDKIPQSEEHRYDPGRSLGLGTIESAIRNAEVGMMTDLTDVAGKALDLDPRLASYLARRFGQLEACEWSITPATGEGIDKVKAKQIADAVAKELRLLPSPTNWGDEPKPGAGLAPLIECLMWGFWDGRASVEKIWSQIRPTPGRVVTAAITELQWLHPRRISFGPRREPRLVDANFRIANFAEIGLDLTSTPGKFINFLPQLFREYPEREGYAPRCMYWAFFKRFGNRERNVLMELFGRPWKILEYDAEARLTDTQIEDAEDAIESLGAATQATLPKGAKLTLPWPHPESGGVHKDVIDLANEELACLLLGSPMTTEDAGSRAQGEVGERQQDVYLQRDGRRMVGLLQPALVAPIVQLNAKPFELPNDDAVAAYTPQLEIHTESEPDRNAEVERLLAVISTGAPVGTSQVYEISGIRPPEADEEVVVSTSPVAKVYDSIKAAKAYAEAREAKEEEMRQAELAAAGGKPPPGGPGEAKPNDKSLQRTAQPQPKVRAQPGPGGVRTTASDPEIERFYERIMTTVVKRAGSVLLTASEQVPELEDDPREHIAAAYQRRARTVFASWITVLSVAMAQDTLVAAQVTLGQIVLDPEPMANLLYASALQASVLAANEVLVEAQLLPRAIRADAPGQPFKKAVEAFKAKGVVTRDVFDTLDQEAKRRAFTLAEATSLEMAEAVKAELAESLILGEDIRKFRARVNDRLKAEGFSPLSPRYLETVFRTNVMEAYGVARFDVARQPHVVAVRPVWMWVSTLDARTRPNHAAPHGKMMLAMDPTWDRVRPPAGFNCRCTIRTFRMRDAEERDGAAIAYTKDPANKALPDTYELTDGADPVWADLPDKGFGRELRIVAMPWLLGRDNYDPNQPRDERGRWVETGAGVAIRNGPNAGKSGTVRRVEKGSKLVVDVGGGKQVTVKSRDVAKTSTSKAEKVSAFKGLAEQVKKNPGGFTWNPQRGAPSSGIMCAYDASEKRGFKLTVDGDESDEEIRASLKSLVASQLDFVDEDPDHRYFGGWADVDKATGDIQGVYIEVSERFDVDRETDAIQAAKARNQIAVFRLDDFTEIPTGGTGEASK